jgi:hypothetical protein
MAQFEIELTNDFICSNSGLAFLGQLLDMMEFNKQVEGLSKSASNLQIDDTEILRSYLGLLCLGKNSYEAIDDYKDDEYFMQAIGVDRLPSKESLRQRLEQLSTPKAEAFIRKFNLQPLKRFGEYKAALDSGLIPVDFDVTPMDNSKSNKEGVSNTYKQHDGFAPMMTYIGGTGFMLNNQLREGKAHSNCEGTSDYIMQTMEYARSLTKGQLLARLDSGNDSAENIVRLNALKWANFIIKKNFRREDTNEYMLYARGMASETETPRPGKIIYHADRKIQIVYADKNQKKHKTTIRQVLRMSERTIDKHGHALLIPEIEIEAWFTNLSVDEFTAKQVISLYADHGTSEQFHSEYKTDMDMERLPSGKFETNSLIMLLGMLAFNVLRIIGQQSLKTGLIKRKRKIQRIRIRKVLQDIMYMACHFMIKYKRKTIQLARCNAYALAFMMTYKKIANT